MSTIRENISEILEVRIEENGWKSAVHRLDVSGKITQRKMLEMIVALCQKVEELEHGKKDSSV